MIRRLLASAFWRVGPWTLKTQPAPGRPSLFVGTPHTSNWDFMLMLGIAWKLQVRIKWLGKAELFRSWRGPVMRALGGIPVDRDEPGRVVREVVGTVRSGKAFGLVITPDGTRREHEYWKSGFYRIARETGLPLTLGYVDRDTMTSGLGPTFSVTGDVAADMDRIRAFFADKAGYIPSRRVEPRLRDETGTA